MNQVEKSGGESIVSLEVCECDRLVVSNMLIYSIQERFVAKTLVASSELGQASL